MKVSSWQDIIISWANALRLLDEPVNDVLDLVKGQFFIRLLNKTKNLDREREYSFSEDDVYNVIEKFLKEEFSGFRLLGYWDNDEVTLVASVLLLWSSLESHSCRTPLFELDDAVQIKIQAFIQRFIETPQHLINRQLVMDAVLDIAFDESEQESMSFSSSPKTYSTPKRDHSSSNYSPAVMALSEMRSLRSKVDLLSCEKQHLQEELEVIKAQLEKSNNKLQQKEAQLMRLSNHVACGESYINWAEERKSNDGADSPKHTSQESSLVKLELEDMKDIVNKLRQDLEATVDENNNLNQQLRDEKQRRIEAEQRCDELEAKNIHLSGKVVELEVLTANLKKNCEEQSLILAERDKPPDDDSLRLVDYENLGGIVDIKYSELQEELKAQTELLDEKTKTVENLLLEKGNAENIIDSLKLEIETLRVQHDHTAKERCIDCEIFKNKVSSSEEKNYSLVRQCENLKEELIKSSYQLKSLTDNKYLDERKLAELQKVMSETICDLNTKIEGQKEEILALQCELCEKNNTIDFYKDEVDFLNNCLASKTVEFNNLENDFTKINTSKDKEISQLIKTIEHLNKETRVLQEQLHAEFMKKDHPCSPASEWRVKISQGQITANEEVARELIALHESLQWKTLKIGDLSLQIEQLRCEIGDKDMLNKELHERLIFLSEKNKDFGKELQANKNSVAHLQSKITEMEHKEKKLNQELVKKNQKFELVDHELKELWKLLKQKFHTIDIEMDTCMLKGKPNLQDIVKFIDYMCEKLKENRKNISQLTIAMNELETDNAEKSAELDKLDKLTSVHAPKAVEQWINQNTFFQDKLKKIETDYENNTIKMRDALWKLNKANELIKCKDEIISELQEDVDKLSKELKEKEHLVECLQQNINLYEHEKSILKKRLSTLSHISEKSECGQHEVMSSQTDIYPERELEADKCSSLEEKSNKSLQEKLLDLQSKMKAQYNEDMKRVVEEYSKKIDQLKVKVKKGCAHIEHLSDELWETSDRLLLAQQEADALRSQLKRTKAQLIEQNNRGTEDCSSFMWIGMDAGNYADEFLPAKSKTIGRVSTLKQLSRGLEEDEEIFNEQCLEDLKAGICRLPSPIGRMSCPAESTRKEEDEGEEVFAVPQGKPRKLKGSIMYRKPGPPTPSISAARHSLPGNERLDLRKGLRERNSNASGKSRLSQLFGSIHLSKPKNIEDSPTPKTKRKGFFQRTFGNRENLPPKT